MQTSVQINTYFRILVTHKELVMAAMGLRLAPE